MRRWSLIWLARVEGESMLPTLAPGDVLLVARPWGPIRPGAVVVADVGGHLIVKRVAQTDGKRCRLGVERPYGWVPHAAICGRVLGSLGPGTGRTAGR